MKRSAKPLARSRLNPVSKDPRKRAQNSAYEKAVREWWAGHDGRCEMMLGYKMGTPAPRLNATFAVRQCQRPANPRPHHMRRRGKFLADKSTFLGLCDHCHIHWLHNHEEEARRLGYLLDRPAKTP